MWRAFRVIGQRKVNITNYLQLSPISITISRMAAANHARPEPGHFALLNKGEPQIDLLLSEAVYFSRAFVIVYKTKLNDRIE